MEIPSDAALLRIFIGEDDTLGGRPLYETILVRARELHIAGATVFRGCLSYGPDSRALKIILRFSEDRPILIEFVESEAKIKELLPSLDALLANTSALVTSNR